MRQTTSVARRPEKKRTKISRHFPLVAAVCIGSGCAALIYQVVWFQMLGLVIGVSSVSLGVVLATFMGGMCIGSLGLARIVPMSRHPLLVLACIELGIGICGALVLVAMPAINGVYATLAPANASGMTGLVLRAAVSSICLLPPTILMGATLPAVARMLATTPRGATRMGFCYAANIFGAVVGCLLAGFYLLPQHDVAVATWFAVAVNSIVAIAAAFLSRFAAPPAAALSGREFRAVDRGRMRSAGPVWTVYLTTTLSGLTALSAEVIWTRHLSLLLGATVYTFALVLAVFLFGLGLGSGCGSIAARRIDPRAALGACQLLLAVAMLWAAWTITQFLPYWPIDVALDVSAPVAMQLDLMRVLWAVLPAALLWGASFPLALAAATGTTAAVAHAPDGGRLMGGLYAANTIGAITGAVATSFGMIVSGRGGADQQSARGVDHVPDRDGSARGAKGLHAADAAGRA